MADTVPQRKLDSDRIRIDLEPLSGVVFEVEDQKVQDLGLTKVVVVSLTAPSETYDGEAAYIIKWALHSKTAEVVQLEPEREAHEITLDSIVAVED